MTAGGVGTPVLEVAAVVADVGLVVVPELAGVIPGFVPAEEAGGAVLELEAGCDVAGVVGAVTGEDVGVTGGTMAVVPGELGTKPLVMGTEEDIGIVDVVWTVD